MPPETNFGDFWKILKNEELDEYNGVFEFLALKDMSFGGFLMETER